MFTDHFNGPFVYEHYTPCQYKDLINNIADSAKRTEVTVRGMDTIEREFVTISQNYTQKIHFDPGRWQDPIFGYVEGLFILLGYSKVEPFAWYAPQMAQFADKDKDFFHGAYGPRLGTTNMWKGTDFARREWLDQHARQHLSPVNQLEAVYKKLKDDPTTRQAVMTIWNPALDNEPHRDIPCTNLFHFLQRDGKLNLNVYMRSQDLMTGFVYDTLQFRWFQQILAEWLVTEDLGFYPGNYNHILGSAHIYKKDLPTIRKMNEHPEKHWRLYDRSSEPYQFGLSLKDWKELIKIVARIELLSRTGKLDNAGDLMCNNKRLFDQNLMYKEICYGILAVNNGKYGDTLAALDIASSINGELRIPALCKALTYHHQKHGEFDVNRFSLDEQTQRVVESFVEDKTGKLKMVD